MSNNEQSLQLLYRMVCYTAAVTGTPGGSRMKAGRRGASIQEECVQPPLHRGVSEQDTGTQGSVEGPLAPQSL